MPFSLMHTFTEKKKIPLLDGFDKRIQRLTKMIKKDREKKKEKERRNRKKV